MIKSYILFGDSGSGKSTFIRSLNGKKEGKLPETNGDGSSCTKDANTYESTLLNQPIMLIDTRGTNDTSVNANDEIIVEGLVDFLLNSKESSGENILNGIIYIHDGLQTCRYHLEQRLSKLAFILSIPLN